MLPDEEKLVAQLQKNPLGLCFLQYLSAKCFFQTITGMIFLTKSVALRSREVESLFPVLLSSLL